MKNSSDIDWLKLPFLSILVIVLLLFVTACGDSEKSSSGDTGSISFSIDWIDAPTLEETDSSGVTRAALDCAAAGVSSVEAIVYNAAGANVAEGGPWLCNAHSGKITGVPVGSNLKAEILGKNIAGNVLYQGEKTGITGTADQETPAGEIAVSSAVPACTVTAGDGQVTITWAPVSGAVSYNIYGSTTEGVVKSEENKIGSATNSPYIHTGVTNGLTYYYLVTAVFASNAESYT